MEFKVGDKVKILDRVGGPTDYFPIYTDEMLKYVGTSTVIKRITIYGFLVLDNSPNYYWDKKAVKLVNEDKFLHPYELKATEAEPQKLNLFPTKKYYQLNFNNN